MVPRDITNSTEDLKSVNKFMKLLYKAEQVTQKRSSDEALLKNSNQGSPEFKQEAEDSCALWWYPQEKHVYQGNMPGKINS